jgi:hypothetical protein
MLNDLSYIKNVFEIRYAPTLWKKKLFKWDLEREYAAAKAQVVTLSRPTTSEYHQILKRFLRSTRDYHVNIDFYATESAFLPFAIRAGGDRFFIVHIDRPALPAHEYPLYVGDELVTFDGLPVKQVLDELLKEEVEGKPTPTDWTLAQRMLTCRSADMGQRVPQGEVVLGVIGKEDGKHRTVTVPWNYTKEFVADYFQLHPQQDFPCLDLSLSSQSAHPGRYFERQATFGGWQPKSVVGASYTCVNKHSLGGKKSFLPRLGKVIWSTKKESPFDAYIFLTPSFHKVGYVRIPTYVAGEDDAKAFAEIIKKMEAESDALVVDQMNNPGGFITYLYALLSMLSDKPLETPKHRITLTQLEVFMAYSESKMLKDVKTDKDAQAILGETLLGYPVTKELVKATLKDCEFLIEQWSKGKLLTDTAHLFGVDYIQPNSKACYTKPLLVLINELDFSCADFFPAILQDNQRATILGTTTSGAGGMVFPEEFPNQTAIKSFRYTASIAFRKNHQPIENCGVKPEILYALTAEDFQTDFTPFKRKILEVLDGFFENAEDPGYEIISL